MRIPHRLQGVALGVSVLVAGPVAAAIVTANAETKSTASTAEPPLTAIRSERSIRIPDPSSLIPLLSVLPHELVPPNTPAPSAPGVATTPPPTTPLPTPLPTPAPTPTPVPAPTPAAVALKAAPKGSIEAIIRAAAAVWHVNGDWMVKIARCESGLNPRAYNPRGPYVGLFQFLPSTFRRNGGTDIMDPADQANVAAKMLAHGQAHQWSCA